MDSIIAVFSMDTYYVWYVLLSLQNIKLTFQHSHGNFSFVFTHACLRGLSGKTFEIFWNYNLSLNSHCIHWNYPPRSNSHHQDYSIFRIGNPNLNLHFWLASWVGGRPNAYTFVSTVLALLFVGMLHAVDPLAQLVRLSLWLSCDLNQGLKKKNRSRRWFSSRRL